MNGQLVGRPGGATMQQQEVIGRAIELSRAGRSAEAATFLDDAAIVDVTDPAMAGKLGVVYHLAARDAVAGPLLERAVNASGDCEPDPIAHLAALRASQGRTAEAAELFKRALALRPTWPTVAYNLGSALLHLQRPEEAIAAYLLATQQQPDMMEAWNGAGLAFAARGRFDEACRHYREALRLAPDSAPVLNNYGVALRALGKPARSIEIYRRCIALQPNNAEFLNNLGVAFESAGRVDEALRCYEDALRLRPDYPEGHAHRGIALLLAGRFAEAWPEYEWRWRSKELAAARRTFEHAPQWAGEPLEGRTILLHSEQGFGDTIQFVRYAGLLAARGATVVVEAPPPLAPLIATATGVARVVARGQASTFDVHCPMLSVPGVLGTTLDSIPSQARYLTADPQRSADFAQRIGPRDGRLRVGLVWAGNPRHRNDRNRSCDLARFAALADVAGVHWFSLQKGATPAQLAAAPDGLTLDPLVDACKDFADTAALIDNLDLVVGVDTSVLHLAAALGKPSWMMVPVLPDWRWMIGRADSPWYPSLRLVRQEVVGLWEPVIERIARELQTIVPARSVNAEAPDEPPMLTVVATRVDAAMAGWLAAARDLGRYARLILTTDRPDEATRRAIDALRARVDVQAIVDVDDEPGGARGFRAGLALATTPYAVWIDRDVSFGEPDWPLVFDRFARTAGPFEVAGHRAYHRRTMAYQGFVEKRPWWRGVDGYPPECVRRVPFALCGCVIVRTHFAREHDFPDGFPDAGRLDVALGDLVLHRGARFAAFPWHVTRCFDWEHLPVEPVSQPPASRPPRSPPAPVQALAAPATLPPRRRRRLVIGVTTTRASDVRQRLTRDGWMCQLTRHPDVEAFFLEGNVDAGGRVERDGDVLRVPVSDSAADVLHKIRYLARYARDHFDMPYVFKCDDDTFVHLPRLLAFAGQADLGEYVGFNHGRTCNAHDFAHGGAGFLIGPAACDALAAWPFDWPDRGDIDDFEVGKQLRAAGVALRHDERFVRNFQPARCPAPWNDAITAHCVTTPAKLAHLRSLWGRYLA